MKRTTTAMAAGLLMAAASCSSSSSSAGAGADFPTCSATEQFHVTGTLNGKTVDISQAMASGGYVNLGDASFSTPFGLAGDDAGPAVDMLQLDWTGPVPDGASAPATGTLTMTAGDPLGAVTLCAGSGSAIVFPPNDTSGGIEFVLKDLTMGPGCTQAVTGQLQGCWASAN